MVLGMPPGSSRRTDVGARATVRPRRCARLGREAPRSGAASCAALAALWFACGPAGCGDGKAPLGPPDSYLVYQPVAGATAAEPGAPAGLRLLQAVAVDDARATPIHRGAAEGFMGELLRTDYLAKELLRNGWQGRTFSPAARARAAEPTVLVLAGTRATRTEEAASGTGFAESASFGRKKVHGDASWIEVGDDPPGDPAFVQTASGRIARLVGDRIAHAADPSAPVSRVLVDGYALAMEVIGREWRVGEGPMGRVAPDAGTGTQRERFAAVRQNAYVFKTDSEALRSADEMLAEPGVVAALIYRMAQAKGVGRKIGPPEIYAPFVKDRVPPGISPAAVLGPVRNFQVKLLTAWALAAAAGHAPRDLIDLVTAYADVVPGERAEVMRLFVATTYGATLKVGGVSPRAADATASLAELTALAAEVTAGRRGLRSGMPASGAAPVDGPAAPIGHAGTAKPAASDSAAGATAPGKTGASAPDAASKAADGRVDPRKGKVL